MLSLDLKLKQKFFSAQINQQSEQYNFSKELLFLIDQNKCKYSYELNILVTLLLNTCIYYSNWKQDSILII